MFYEVIFDVKLEIPGPAAAIGCDPADECPQAGYAFMDALALAAGVGIMDKDRFIDGFQIIHQDMMHYPIAEISGKDLPQFRFFAKKARENIIRCGCGSNAAPFSLSP